MRCTSRFSTIVGRWRNVGRRVRRGVNKDGTYIRNNRLADKHKGNNASCAHRSYKHSYETDILIDFAHEIYVNYVIYELASEYFRKGNGPLMA